MKILVDADSCPVKEKICQIANEYGVAVWLVASLNHLMPDNLGARVVQVGTQAQEVDLEIMQRVESGDLVVTQDFGLAAVVISRGGRCLSPRGKEYTEQNIEGLLAQRHLSARLRRGGGKTKGPSAMKVEDRKRFEVMLRRMLEEKGETNGEI